jgi:hypothetical protein
LANYTTQPEIAGIVGDDTPNLASPNKKIKSPTVTNSIANPAYFKQEDVMLTEEDGFKEMSNSRSKNN